MKQLVVCSLEEWDDVWRRNQFLADRLLRSDFELRILFVEPPADPLHDLLRIRRPRGLRVRTLEADRRLRTFRPLKPLPRRTGELADAALRRQVRLAARAFRFDDPVLWLNDVTYAPLIREAGWPAVYDVTDDWLRAPLSGRELERLRRLDELALRDAAEVVVCSPDLARSRGETRPVTLIRNAVDVEHFRRPRERPDDLPPAPVAVYLGSLHDSRLDVPLVVELARAAPELSVALVGPDSLTPSSKAALAAEPTVHLLGARPYADVPAYLQHADVVVVPHLVDEFTESLDPIKAYECLAVGRPTVATPVAGFRELGDSAAVVARDGFVEAVRKALAGGVGGAVTGEIPSWDERAADFAAVLRGAG
ncbi:MAG TPA: glycosyltransferase [Gaiellaceae bacterium]|nr:glycosyltransferase [Gaiellaceae bacterium]